MPNAAGIAIVTKNPASTLQTSYDRPRLKKPRKDLFRRCLRRSLRRPSIRGRRPDLFHALAAAGAPHALSFARCCAAATAERREGRQPYEGEARAIVTTTSRGIRDQVRRRLQRKSHGLASERREEDRSRNDENTGIVPRPRRLPEQASKEETEVPWTLSKCAAAGPTKEGCGEENPAAECVRARRAHRAAPEDAAHDIHGDAAPPAGEGTPACRASQR
jgi:hypothetical protein